MNFTAVGARDGRSTLECWQLADTLNFSNGLPNTPGLVQLGDISNASYRYIPAGYDDTFHNAPFRQWAVMVKGLGRITLPDDDTSAEVRPGETGVLFVADTPDVSAQGHRSQYPGITETIVVQIPTKDNQIPAHSVLHSGPCLSTELDGLQQFG
ncbi:hypothetical protein F5Y13DRAFT_188469 [Hypoxylon sp. FL1857]|nr:hypothetical protein F5Y13DRAFT_188469 [Hypoxylon sp. FL1857]